MFSDVFFSRLQLAWVHNLDPFAVEFAAGTGIRWYGLSYLCGFLCAYLIISALSKRGGTSLPLAKVSDFIFCVAVGTILGGRLGYCVFYDQTLLTKWSSSFPFWGVLEVHHGGMASHGGIIGIIIACWYFGRKEKLHSIDLLDLVALTGCLGIFFGRVANFVNGELVGRASDSSYIFAVKFPQDIYLWPSLEPERLSSLRHVASLLGYRQESFDEALRRNDDRFFDQLSSRIVHKIERGDEEIRKAVDPILTPRHPSQLYEAALEGAFLFAIILMAWLRYPRRGLASSLFMLLYPIGRIIGERFRMPDAQIGFQLFGLTRGQWISIAMLVVGLVYTAIILRRPEK